MGVCVCVWISGCPIAGGTCKMEVGAKDTHVIRGVLQRHTGHVQVCFWHVVLHAADNIPPAPWNVHEGQRAGGNLYTHIQIKECVNPSPYTLVMDVFAFPHFDSYTHIQIKE